MLPFCKRDVDIIVHDIRLAIYSLLLDLDLMNPKNFIFRDDLYEKPNNIPREIKDINDGQNYKNAYYKWCKGNKDVLCVIILFCDQTHCNTNGNLKLEPLIMTLGIFNKECQWKSQAWRTVGYIPNMGQFQNKKLNASQKQADYHTMLDVVVSPIATIQTKHNGIYWKIPWNNELHPTILKCPVLFIMGDSQGHDKLCGQILNYGISASHLCRYCDCPLSQTDNPYYKFKYQKQKQVQNLLEKKDVAGLNSIGYGNIGSNAMHQLNYCDDKRGIHGALLGELLHTWQHGLFVYAVDALFKLKRVKVTKKGNHNRIKNSNIQPTTRDKSENKSEEISVQIINEDTSSEDNDLNIDNTDDKLLNIPVSKRNVFSKEDCDSFDSDAVLYGRFFQQQSDCDLPRCYFSNRLTKNSKRKGHKMQGVILIILSILLSSCYDKYAKYINDKRLADLIHLFELMIMMEEYMKQKVMLRKSVICLKSFMPMFLEHYKSCVNWSCKFLKFHLPLHLADDILDNGPPTGYNSSIGESHHKTVAKQTSWQTQMRLDKLEEQTSLQYVENVVIEKAYNSLPNPLNYVEYIKEDPINRLQGLSFRVNYKGIFHLNKGKTATLVEAEWNNKILQVAVHSFICHHILPNVSATELYIYTKAKIKGNIFHGNPKYNNKSLHNWVYINWGEDYGITPNQILCYIDLSSLNRSITINSTYINRKGLYALIHMIEHPLDSNLENKAHQDSRLFYWSQKMLSKPSPPSKLLIPMIGIAHIESFVQTCIGIPFNLRDEGNHSFLFLKPRKVWPTILDQFMKYILEKNKGLMHLDEEETGPVV